MNTIAAAYQPHEPSTAPRDVSSGECCFHCGLPVPASARFGIRFDGALRPLCCVGCEAVARTIVDAGLGQFYRQRTGTSPSQQQHETTGRERMQADLDTLFNVKSVSANYVSAPDAAHHTADLYIDGITCAACVWLAESALQRIPGVDAASVNQITHRASVRWKAGTTQLGAIRAALRRVGLDAQPASAPARFAARRAQRRRALIELGVALLGMMQVMMFTVPLYFFAAEEVSNEARLLMGWAGLVLTLPVLLISARTFFVGAWRDLRIRHVGMDVPITLAIVLTFASSTLSLLGGGGDLYFDSISMFVFLLLAARYLESSARESSLQWIERLTDAAPAMATRIAGYPNVHGHALIAASELQVGDTIRIATGEAVAADGCIVEGASDFDESLITGESQPVLRNVADTLAGGSLNLGAPVLMRVTGIGEATTLAHLRRLTEQALAARPRFAEVADRFSRWIAPLTILLASAAALVWWGIDPARSLGVAAAVLAVTCPCALALAVPTAHALAITRLAREGMLITRAGTMEKMASATDIVFDKTGTLTQGDLTVAAVQVLGPNESDEIIAIAVALEAGSLHPVARALRQLNSDEAQPTLAPVANRLSLENGAGVAGTINGVQYRLGTRRYVESLVSHALPAGTSMEATLFLGSSRQWLAAIVLSDALKVDATKCVNGLCASGLTAHILSGDRWDRVAHIADAVGINQDTVRAEQTPSQKLAYARAIQISSRSLIAVGDGVNDAPLLGAADVSIAMGVGADLTRLTADAVLLSPRLAPLVTARNLARKMQRVIRQNFAWAILYNAIAVPLAITGQITPAWAAIGMALSSLAVVANSLRLNWRSGILWKS